VQSIDESLPDYRTCSIN